MKVGIERSSYRTEGCTLQTIHASAGLLTVDGLYEEGQIVALVGGIWEKYVPADHDLDVTVDFVGETVTVQPDAVLGIVKDEIDTTGASSEVVAPILVSGRVRKSDVTPTADDTVVERLYKSGIYCE